MGRLDCNEMERAACVLLSQKLDVDLPDHLIVLGAHGVVDPIEQMYRAWHNVSLLTRLCHGRRYITAESIPYIWHADLLSKVAVAILVLQDELHTSNVLLHRRDILEMLVKDEKPVVWFEAGKDLLMLGVGSRIYQLSRLKRDLPRLYSNRFTNMVEVWWCNSRHWLCSNGLGRLCIATSR